MFDSSYTLRKEKNSWEKWFHLKFEISVLRFYRYIINIRKILVDILIKISIDWTEMTQNSCLQNFQKIIKYGRIYILKLFYKYNWHKYN